MLHQSVSLMLHFTLICEEVLHLGQRLNPNLKEKSDILGTDFVT